MKLARSISFGMTALGVVLTAAGVVLDMSPIVTITGMMLVVAGVVKIGMVAIWQSMFRAPHGGQQPATRMTGAHPGASGNSREV